MHACIWVGDSEDAAVPADLGELGHQRLHVLRLCQGPLPALAFDQNVCFEDLCDADLLLRFGLAPRYVVGSGAARGVAI